MFNISHYPHVPWPLQEPCPGLGGSVGCQAACALGQVKGRSSRAGAELHEVPPSPGREKPLELLMHRPTQDLEFVHFRVTEILKICYIT